MNALHLIDRIRDRVQWYHDMPTTMQAILHALENDIRSDNIASKARAAASWYRDKVLAEAALRIEP